jgi:hypothetical protein
MDNPANHEPPRGQTTIEATRTGPPNLPPYSAESNLIANAFAKLKARPREEAPRTVDGLWSAIGRLIHSVMPAKCGNMCAAAGFDPE